MNSQYDIHSSINPFNLNGDKTINIENKGDNSIPDRSSKLHSKLINQFENLNANMLQDNEFEFKASLPINTIESDKANSLYLNIFSTQQDEDDELDAIINSKEQSLVMGEEGEIETQMGQIAENVAVTKEKISQEEIIVAKEEKSETLEQITIAREFKFKTDAKDDFSILTKHLESWAKENDVAFIDPAGRQLHDVLLETFENILQDFSINDDPSKIFQECVSRLANNGQLVKKEADGTTRALNETELVSFTQQIETIFGNYLLDQLQTWFKQEENKNQVVENKQKPELNASYKQLEKYARNHEPLTPEAKKTLEKLIHTKLYANALQFGEIIKKLLEANKKDREIQAEIRAIERKFEILKKEILRWELLSEVKKSDDLKHDVSKSDLKGKVWRPVGDLISLHKATAAIAA